MEEIPKPQKRQPLKQQLTELYTLVVTLGLVAGYETFGGKYPKFDEELFGTGVGTIAVEFINNVIEEVVWVPIICVLTRIKYLFQSRKEDE